MHVWDPVPWVVFVTETVMAFPSLRPALVVVGIFYSLLVRKTDDWVSNFSVLKALLVTFAFGVEVGRGPPWVYRTLVAANILIVQGANSPLIVKLMSCMVAAAAFYHIEDAYKWSKEFVFAHVAVLTIFYSTTSDFYNVKPVRLPLYFLLLYPLVSLEDYGTRRGMCLTSMIIYEGIDGIRRFTPPDEYLVPNGLLNRRGTFGRVKN